MPVLDDTKVYRDATISKATQERLRLLLRRLTSEPGWNEGDRRLEIEALAAVIDRWDANDATEIVAA